MPNKKKIVICANTAWNLWNFRRNLIRSLVERGFEVVAVAPYDSFAELLPSLGCRFVHLEMDNGGTNPIADIALYFAFKRLFKIERPDVFLGYTIKPNIYGSLAANRFNIGVINNIAGVGAVFINKSILTPIVEFLYRKGLKRSWQVFFQNNDDREQFIKGGQVDAAKATCLPGSGIDLAEHAFEPAAPMEGRKFRFLFVGRMLRNKGVVEFEAAARSLKSSLPDVEWTMLGSVDVPNPTSISQSDVDAWQASGSVRYLGFMDDVRPELARADCVVLPSYREGTPRSLLEAAAIGRPIITTDTPGCRNVVDDGSNGYLCRAADPADLAEKMLRMVSSTEQQRLAMGRAGREKMVREFDIQLVIDKYASAIQGFLDSDHTR